MTTREWTEPPTFSGLLARADDETLQMLVGAHAIRLLSALDPSFAAPSHLRDICLQLHSPEALLRNPDTRSQLLALLRQEHAADLASQLGLNGLDPYNALFSARFQNNSKREQRLLAFFGLTPTPEEAPQKVTALDSAPAAYELFDHQRRAVQEIVRSRERRILLHMPTGAGKTRTALHVVARALRREDPTVIVWLAHSEELCEQASAEFKSAWSHLGDRRVDIYHFWGQNNLDISEVRDGFMIAGLAKTYQRAKRDSDFLTRLADRVSLVIIDEAHQAIADTYSFLLDYLVNRQTSTMLLGLTATPGRTWNDPSIDAELARFFQRNKVTLNVPGYPTPVDYLIDEGFLARPVFRPLPYTPGEPLTDRQLRQLATALDVPESILKRLAEDAQRNMIIVNAAEDLLKHHRRLIIFAATVSHTHLIATVLRARGFTADAVTNSTPRDERSRIISRYKNDDDTPMALCNYGVLTTGFDAPRTSAAIVARPTTSLVLYSQMIGRAMRGPLAGGNVNSEIVTIVDSDLPGFGSLSDAFTNWEDVWDD